MSDVVVPKRILVADDDSSILRLVTCILRRVHYQVDTAVNGREALARIDATQYDAVMLDLSMPELTGCEVLARLKVREAQTRFVIIMSAGSRDVIASSVSLHVFATLRKPFEVHELLATVRACIAFGSETPHEHAA